MKKLLCLSLILLSTIFSLVNTKKINCSHMFVTYFEDSNFEKSFFCDNLDLKFPINVDSVRIDLTVDQKNHVLQEVNAKKIFEENVDNIHICYYQSNVCDRYVVIKNKKIYLMVADVDNKAVIGFPIIRGSF